MNKLIVNYAIGKGRMVKEFKDMCFYNIPLQDIQQYLNGLYPMFSVYIEHVEEQIDGEIVNADIIQFPENLFNEDIQGDIITH